MGDGLNSINRIAAGALVGEDVMLQSSDAPEQAECLGLMSRYKNVSRFTLAGLPQHVSSGAPKPYELQHLGTMGLVLRGSRRTPKATFKRPYLDKRLGLLLAGVRAGSNT